jgi:hypothetical protein
VSVRCGGRRCGVTSVRILRQLCARGSRSEGGDGTQGARTGGEIGRPPSRTRGSINGHGVRLHFRCRAADLVPQTAAGEGVGASETVILCGRSRRLISYRGCGTAGATLSAAASATAPATVPMTIRVVPQPHRRTAPRLAGPGPCAHHRFPYRTSTLMSGPRWRGRRLSNSSPRLAGTCREALRRRREPSGCEPKARTGRG